MNNTVMVIGAGLAGSEAAWQLAEAGVSVKLYEMRQEKMTPAHQTGKAGELVCSNSLRAKAITNAAGLLKEELRLANSLIMQAADATEIPAGGALAVDREAFSLYIDERLSNHPNIERITAECQEIPAHRPTIIATGPLTSEAMFKAIQNLGEADDLYFYDAAAPIVMASSIDMEQAFWQNRYDKGDQPDYLNCPLTKEEYDLFYQALMEAEWAPTHEFEEEKFFEGCMPIETMASRGYDTLRHGPMKPVGLIDPKTGKQPYAVLQLRRDDRFGELFNLVGFQTRMTWPAQRAVFSHIPALKHAEYARYGVMHRNTFMNSPTLLDATGALKSDHGLFFAGQLTGVEGYVESTASGLVCAYNALRSLRDLPLKAFPKETAIGSLMHYITATDGAHFQPMNVTFGLLPPLERKIRNKKERNEAYAQRAMSALTAFLEQENEL